MSPRGDIKVHIFFTAKTQRTQREGIFCFLLRGQKAKRLSPAGTIMFCDVRHS